MTAASSASRIASMSSAPRLRLPVRVSATNPGWKRKRPRGQASTCRSTASGATRTPASEPPTALPKLRSIVAA